MDQAVNVFGDPRRALVDQMDSLKASYTGCT
jgi:hypothetical protein